MAVLGPCGGCPCNESPTIWGLLWGPLMSGNSPVSPLLERRTAIAKEMTPSLLNTFSSAGRLLCQQLQGYLKGDHVNETLACSAGVFLVSCEICSIHLVFDSVSRRVWTRQAAYPAMHFGGHILPDKGLCA